MMRLAGGRSFAPQRQPGRKERAAGVGTIESRTMSSGIRILPGISDSGLALALNPLCQRHNAAMVYLMVDGHEGATIPAYGCEM
jgi:prepilin-type processing-associated H-X9-DG protein